MCRASKYNIRSSNHPTTFNSVMVRIRVVIRDGCRGRLYSFFFICGRGAEEPLCNPSSVVSERLEPIVVQ